MSNGVATERPEEQPGQADRWTLIRDLAVFQAKLVIDGLRDLVLVPASLVAGIVSLVTGSDGQPGPQFYRLLGLGRQSEHWINLFGAYANAPAEVQREEPFPKGDIDEIVGRLEAFVVAEQRRGGITAQAREHIDKALDALQRRK